MKKISSKAAALLFAASFFAATGAFSQPFDGSKYYRLTCMFQGDNKSLDVINDGKNDKLTLAKTGNFSGQYWKITPTKNGHYRLTSQFQGDGKALDVINDGKNDKLTLASTADNSGQHWKLTPIKDGYFRLTCMFQGDGKALDVINDGKNDKLTLASTADNSGQFWKLTEVSTGAQTGSGVATKSTLLPGETLKIKEKLVSANGQFYLTVQQDGNLCIYKSNDAFVWCSMAHGFDGAKLVMQADGNLVVYDGGNTSKWDSKTHPFLDKKFKDASLKPTKLVLENDGKLKLYNAAGTAVWANQ